MGSYLVGPGRLASPSVHFLQCVDDYNVMVMVVSVEVALMMTMAVMMMMMMMMM